ncbi:nucleotide exchange factor GrpE [Atopobium fossor]|uniref:nucleotide exchange factor GrpE n=1 Tax=Atopobium fossor TaxID=39487 RepID=UPI00041BD759|nr:nucleotide exchange factor GrpE [Atopobium fossor]
MSEDTSLKPEDIEEPKELEQDMDVQDGQGADDSASAAPELDEEALVAEAIRRGEEAAEADLKAEADTARSERDELAAKLEEALEAKASAQERAARVQADWENYRKRTAGERLAERALATEKLVCNLLPVIDDLERALAHANTVCEGNEDLASFTKGVDAVRAKFLDVLGREGVEVINPAGEVFDPLAHQAVGRVDDANDYADTVRDVYQLGYRMGTKVIRPAMVTVTFNGPARPVPAVEEQVDEEAVADKATDKNE